MATKRKLQSADTPKKKKRNVSNVNRNILIAISSVEWTKYESMINNRFSNEIGCSYRYNLHDKKMGKIIFLNEMYFKSLQEYQRNDVGELVKHSENICQMSIDYILSKPIFQYNTTTLKRFRRWYAHRPIQCAKWKIQNKTNFNKEPHDTILKYKSIQSGIFNLLKLYQQVYYDLKFCIFRELVEKYCINNDNNWTNIVYEYVGFETNYSVLPDTYNTYFCNIEATPINKQKQWNLLVDIIKCMLLCLKRKYKQNVEAAEVIEWRYITIKKNVCEINATMSQDW
eukprot:75999_1